LNTPHNLLLNNPDPNNSGPITFNNTAAGSSNDEEGDYAQKTSSAKRHAKRKPKEKEFSD
jgi:hypothetical protein